MTKLSRALSWIELLAVAVFFVQAFRIAVMIWGVDRQEVLWLTAAGLFASAATTGVAGALLRVRCWRYAGQVLIAVPVWLWTLFFLSDR